MIPSIRSGLAAEGYETYAKLVDAAKRVEARNEDNRKIKFKGISSTGTTQSPGKKRDRDEGATGTGGLPPRPPQAATSAPTQGQTARSGVVCHNCGRTGHVQANCRLAARGTTTITYYKCGQPGHLRRDCPQWQRVV